METPKKKGAVFFAESFGLVGAAVMRCFGLVLIACVVIELGFGNSTWAQVGKDSGLWDWTEVAPHHQAIVEVRTGDGTGTGIVISIDESKPIKDGFEGYCLTAWHVVEEDQGKGEILIKFSNGRKSKGCRVVEFDEEKDVALLWVWVPKAISPAKLATEAINGGDEVEMAGLGGGSSLECCIRHFSATASPPSSGEKIFADVPLLPGDSGGPVFNSDHEVVGIISGGWFWYDSGVVSKNGNQIRTTWPARASNIGPIKGLIASRASKVAAKTTIR